ncbi:MAG: alpha/beta hydrolase [Candidatus Melainabacteria bacterium]|nr:alpha/beta hydrolase [Candidatus Melainabacteria bacterium]
MIPDKATITVEEGKTDSGIFYRKTFTSISHDTLVLVMGYGGSLRIWPTTFVERLAELYNVITYDNRGTGLSIIPQQAEDYTIKAMADDLREVTKSLKITKHHLLGYSMGSCIALQYAFEHSDIVSSLVLMCGTAGGAEYVKPAKEISTALANPQGKTLWDIYMYTWQLMYSPEHFERCQPAFKSIYEMSKDLPTRPLALLGHSNAFRGFDGSTYLGALKMPTTIIAGRDDRLMPYLNSENLSSKISGARLVLVDDCEHAPHIQCEELVIDEIKRTCSVLN